MAGSDGNSRYFHTADTGPERFRQWKPGCIGGGEINDKADNGLLDKIAASDAEAANLDQPGQPARRPDHHLPVAGFKMDTIIPDQHGQRQLARAPGHDEIEGEMRFAGA